MEEEVQREDEIELPGTYRPFTKKRWTRRLSNIPPFDLQKTLDAIGVESISHGATLMGLSYSTFEDYVRLRKPITRRTRMQLEAIKLLNHHQRTYLAKLGYTISEKGMDK